MFVHWLLAAGAIALLTPIGADAAQGSPSKKEILGMAARQSWAFCHPKDLSKGGCELHAALMKDEWVVIVSPKLRGATGSITAARRTLIISSTSRVLVRSWRG
jgi:hypothetical protein